MKIGMATIELDASIQCRAEIDVGVVNDYAERMQAGDKFPPVELFGTATQSWPGDGWHRIMAARSIGARHIEAKLHRGGRVNALKHALSANALHGHRRTNADKRRCVELALAEFGKLSDRAVAKMCGVNHETVGAQRPQLAESATSPRTGQDGKQYPATRKAAATEERASVDGQEDEREKPELPKAGPPCMGMHHARIAVMNLEEIREDDAERHEAFEHVKGWLAEHER